VVGQESRELWLVEILLAIALPGANP